MTLADSDEPILERVKHLVPPVDHIAKSLQIEHETSKRLHALMLINRAAQIEAGEQASQNLLNIEDTINAQATQISNQRANMEAMERFADAQSGAATVAQNQDVWFANDAPSIGHVLTIANLGKVTEAAKKMKLSRVAEIIDALLSATEGR